MTHGKIPYKYTDKISYLYYYISSLISPSLKKFSNNKLTPNMITTSRIFVFILSIYNLYIGDYIYSAILLNIYYFMDCLDGYYARKYDMVTVFGDYLDHITDISCYAIVLMIIFYNFQINYILILLILLFNSLLHIGCEERYIKENDNGSHDNTLNVIRDTCTLKEKKMKQYLDYGGYFGTGFKFLYISILFVYFKSVSR